MRWGICLLFNINIDADSVDLDQTAPKGAVWSASTLFVYEASKVFSKQQNIQLFVIGALKVNA